MIKTSPDKCRGCIYGSKVSVGICNYFLDTGKRRGCKVGECDKFTPGRRKPNNKPVVIKAIDRNDLQY